MSLSLLLITLDSLASIAQYAFVLNVDCCDAQSLSFCSIVAVECVVQSCFAQIFPMSQVRGFQEVMTPNVYDVKLWKTSGHYANYKENMFLFEAEEVEFGMKPMNCPGHCVIFKHTLHSYRDLPIRFADFGVLHRNELSGALTGLTRVRRFCQDDAHIFCRVDQIGEEIRGALAFLKHIYGILGFTYSLKLSTRPPGKFLGAIETWDAAELALATSLSEFGQPWEVNAGDGAFYGPKIDIILRDALGRKHQCATIQLDFQLPLRFGLSFKNNEGKLDRPVMIHRAILGSVERMIAVLCEHTGGRWPLWLSPRQINIVPVDLKYVEYAQSVHAVLHGAGYFVDIDDSKDQLKKKIAKAAKLYNCILVLGEKEQTNGSINLRLRDKNPEQHQEMSMPEFLAFLADQVAQWQ
jgi:threonyl-tRNA synthetase